MQRAASSSPTNTKQSQTHHGASTTHISVCWSGWLVVTGSECRTRARHVRGYFWNTLRPPVKLDRYRKVGWRLCVLWKETGPRGTGHRGCNTQPLQTGQVSGFWVSGWSWGWVVSVHVGVECESEKEEESGARSHLKQCLHCMTHRGVRPAFTATGQSSTRRQTQTTGSPETGTFLGFHTRQQTEDKTPASSENTLFAVFTLASKARCRSLDIGSGCLLR